MNALMIDGLWTNHRILTTQHHTEKVHCCEPAKRQQTVSNDNHACKVSAKNRLSEEKAKPFAFLSERFLFKPKTIQNKIRFIFIVEVQPNLGVSQS